MTTFSFRHYRRSSSQADIGTLIERHSCGAIDLESAIAHIESQYMGGFRPETDVADLRDEHGALVWQKTTARS